jgi:rubrerythrin
VGGAAVTAGATPFLLGIRDAFARAEGDAGILQAAVELEQRMVLAYDSALRSGKLDAASTRVARLFRKQEQAHVDSLTAALRDLGGKPPPRPRSPREVPGLAAALREGQAAITRFAIELETMAVAGYYDAQGKLESPQLLSTTASIMANEAQHLAVLRQALGRNPSPEAFVTGGRSR